MLQRKSSSNTNSSLSSSSTSVSPIVQQAKLNDEMNNNRSLNDLSQFVQLNKEERSFLPPPPPPSNTNQSDERDGTTVPTKTDSSITDTKLVFDLFNIIEV
jgi:hypothetical protein